MVSHRNHIGRTVEENLVPSLTLRSIPPALYGTLKAQAEASWRYPEPRSRVAGRRKDEKCSNGERPDRVSRESAEDTPRRIGRHRGRG